MKKIYVHNAYVRNDKELFEELERAKTFREKGEMIKALLVYKSICEGIRKDLRINCLVGLYKTTEKGTGEPIVLINLYDVEASQDIYFQQHYDNEKKEFYIKLI